jgi:hypothetical protein
MKSYKRACSLLVLVLLGVWAPAQQRSSPGGDKAGPSGNPITFEGVLKLVRDHVPEQQILEQLADSPTLFTLDDKQLKTLEEAGAGPDLLEVMQKIRDASNSDVGTFAVILDCSGSMRDKTPDGVSKMDAAKKVVTEFINDLPNGRRLTFIVYGHKLWPASRARSCEAVEVVLPLTELTDSIKRQLAANIDRLEPTGWTPLAASLKVAGEQLKKARGICQVIVVTDGMESCDGDPAAEAKALKEQLDMPQGVSFIPFNVPTDEKGPLDDSIERGGAKAYKAEKVADLKKQLKDSGEDARNAARQAAREGARRMALLSRERGSADAAAKRAAEAELRARKAAEQARKSADGAAADAEKAAAQAKDAALEFQGGEEKLKTAPADSRKALAETMQHAREQVDKAAEADKKAGGAARNADRDAGAARDLVEQVKEARRKAEDAQVAAARARRPKEADAQARTAEDQAMKARAAAEEAESDADKARKAAGLAADARGDAENAAKVVKDLVAKLVPPPVDDPDDPGAVGNIRHPLPQADRITWDVHLLEDNPEHFLFWKRVVKGNEVRWWLKVKSEQAELFLRALNKKEEDFVFARFTDGDDRERDKVELQPNTRDIVVGKFVRLTLKLPPAAVLDKTAKVSIVFEKGSRGRELPRPSKEPEMGIGGKSKEKGKDK